MKNGSKKAKVKNNDSKSFINSKGKLSGKNRIKKVDYSKAAIGGIYFPPEFYPTGRIIAELNLTPEEIKYFPYLVAHYYLDFEGTSPGHSKANMACAYSMATPSYEGGRAFHGDSIYTRNVKKNLLTRLDLLTNLDTVPSN